MFKLLRFEEGFGGIQASHSFPNGYEVSVIKNTFTYGGELALYQLAVLKNGLLCYDSGITGGVLGWLSEGQVSFYMGKVSRLRKGGSRD